MNRRAILIEAANIVGCDYIPGAEKDVENYRQYLTSKVGGLWYGNEIVVLSKPSHARILAEIHEAERKADYLFLSFSGHGYMKRPNPLLPSYLVPSEKELTMLCINDTEELSLAEINPNMKNFVIADSCRGFEEMEKAAALVEKFEDRLVSFSESLARKIFDDAVVAAESGQILAYSCSVNESADEDKNKGGLFSTAMMECGFTLAGSGTQRAISTKEVFDCAHGIVKRLAAQQNPQFAPGRRLRHFPFALKAQ